MPSDDRSLSIRYDSPRGRGTVAAVVLGSGMAFLDSTVINVALPALGEDLGVGFSALQWVLNGYLLTLGSLLLLGGALGDRYGRRLLYLLGLLLFTIASVAAGLAPNGPALIGARIVQGVGAAMLVPGSLAIIGGLFPRGDREKAIGVWAAMSGLTTAIGPFVGGWLVDAVSWRLVFFINVPMALATVWLTLRHIPENRDATQTGSPDVVGAATATAGIGALVVGFIEGPARGWSSPFIVTALSVGSLLLAAFPIIERRIRHPMLPLELFRVSRFSGANAATFVVYGALNVSLFLIVLQLQRTLGYSALEAGLALMPINLLLLAGSPLAGRIAARYGHRLPLVVGPTIAAAGMALAVRIVGGTSYLAGPFPSLLVFAIGLTLTVAPITAAALDAVDERRSGVASGVNNAVARLGGLFAVAIVPLAAGIAGASQLGPDELTPGFQRSMWIGTALLLGGALISALTIGPKGASTSE